MIAIAKAMSVPSQNSVTYQVEAGIALNYFLKESEVSAAPLERHNLRVVHPKCQASSEET